LKGERSGRILLAYGDALTTNTAQGTTVTEHIHAIPAGSRLVSAFGAYTSGSRHREQSFIATAEGAERAEIVARRPLGDRREIMRGDILNKIIRNFSQQSQKESALGMLDRAAAMRRGTIQMVQSSLRSAESRAAARKAPTTLNERFAGRRALIRRWESGSRAWSSLCASTARRSRGLPGRGCIGRTLRCHYSAPHEDG